MGTHTARFLVSIGLVGLLATACTSTGEKVEAPPPAPAVHNYVVRDTHLFHDPSDKAKVPAPDGSGHVENRFAPLARLDEVILVEQQGTWSRIETDRKETGWARAKNLIPAAGVAPAVTVASAPLLVAPGGRPVAGGKSLPSGTVVLSLKTQQGFTEVNYQAHDTAWLLDAQLSTAAIELRAGRVLAEIRALEAKDPPAAKKLAREKFAELKGARLRFAVAAASGDDIPITTVFELAMHGNSPTLAWSKDSKRFVTNAAYGTGVGFSDRPEAESGQGIFLVNVAEDTWDKVHPRPGFHPFWLDQERIVWGVSSWFSDAEGADSVGVYVYDAGRARRIPPPDPDPHSEDDPIDVFNVHPGKNGKVLFSPGCDSERCTWRYLDVDTGAVSEAAESDDTWTVPKDLADTQCRQQVDNLVAKVDAETGYTLSTPERSLSLTKQGPPVRYFLI